MSQPLNLARFRKLLEDERARVLHEIDDLQAQDSTADQSDEQGELSAYDNHPADAGTETFMRERDLAMEESAEGILQQVEIALKKIDAGAYGVCERCGKPIGAARLEAIPYTAFCIEDAERFAGQR